MKYVLRLTMAAVLAAPLGAIEPAGADAPKTGQAGSGEAKPAGNSGGAKGSPKSSSSLDDELFKDLDDGTGKPKEAAKPAEAKPAPVKSDAAKPSEGKPSEAKTGDAAPAPDSNSKPEIKPGPAKPAGDEPAPGAAAKPLPKPSNPLDAELLKDLEGDSPEAQKPKQQPKTGAAGGGKPSDSDSDDPLVRLSRRIRDAETRIRRSESGEETQRLQRDIVEDLEKLIATIEEQQKKSRPQSGQGGAKPNDKPGDAQQQGQQQGQQQKQPGDQDKPARDSDDDGSRKTAGRKPDPGRLRNMLDKVWGNLPERERQDVMQSSVDDFPVKYQYVIEEYFRTLLERRE